MGTAAQLVQHNRVLALDARRARAVTIPGAGHDLHLDSPAAWHNALEGFLSSLGPVA